MCIRDRYQDIQPAVILTKVDLDRGEKLESLYADAGIPVYLVDYDKPETIDLSLIHI